MERVAAAGEADHGFADVERVAADYAGVRVGEAGGGARRGGGRGGRGKKKRRRRMEGC